MGWVCWHTPCVSSWYMYMCRGFTRHCPTITSASPLACTCQHSGNNLDNCLLATARIRYTWCIFCLHARCPFSSYLRPRVCYNQTALQRARQLKANNSLRSTHNDLLHGGRLCQLSAPQPCATRVTQQMQNQNPVLSNWHHTQKRKTGTNKPATHKWHMQDFPSE
jgi:hypothetical protein